jgi:hypothetical protein
MKPAQVLLMVMVMVAVTACQSPATPAPTPTPPPTWQEFRSEDGRYRVSLPGQAVSGKVPLPVLGDDIDLQGQQTKYQNMLFFVAQAAAPADVLAADDPDVFHKTWLDAALNLFKGHLISTTPLELNGHVGQEYLIEVPDGLKTPGGGVLRVREYLVNDHIYVAAHFGSKRDSMVSDVRKFLDSFQILIVPTPQPTSSAWPVFNSLDGRFGVRLPATPMKKHEYLPFPGFAINQFVFTTPYQDSVLLLSYGDLPENVPPFDPVELLKEYRDTLVRQGGGTVKQTELIQLGDYPGLDYTVVLPKSTKNPQGIVGHARIYLVGERVYALEYVARPSMADAPEANQFFDSFQITPEAKQP